MALGTTNNNSATAAGELTAEQVQRILIQPLEERSVFLASGPRIFDSNGSPVRIPKQADPTSPQWLGENEAAAESNPSFDEVTLLPQNMKSVVSLARVSNQLIRQGIVDVLNAIQGRFVTDCANKIDAALIASTVTDGSNPTGILSYSGVQTLSVGGALSLDNVIDAWGLALAANVNISNLRWFLRPETFTALRKIKAGTGLNNYVLTPDPTVDGVFRLFGAPVILTNKIPVTGASGSHVTKGVLADMSQVAIARDSAPRVSFDTSRWFEYRQTGILVECRYDAAPLNPEAIVRLDGITAAG